MQYICKYDAFYLDYNASECDKVIYLTFDAGYENGNVETISFGNLAVAAFRSTDSEDLVIDLGKQVAVKKISINVTGNRGNKNISEIAKIEFLNNVYNLSPSVPDKDTRLFYLLWENDICIASDIAWQLMR